MGLGADCGFEGRSERSPRDDPELVEGSLPWVKGVLLVGWWGVVAVVVASVFFFGAIVGGFK